jgi:hypothetical protein
MDGSVGMDMPPQPARPSEAAASKKARIVTTHASQTQEPGVWQ